MHVFRKLVASFSFIVVAAMLLSAVMVQPAAAFTAPTVVSVVGTDPAVLTTTSGTVVFTVTFSAAVKGVDTADFSTIEAGGLTGSSVSLVTALDGGATYTVTVLTGSFTGTLGLHVLNNGTILDDVTDVPLASDFSAGDTYTIVNPAVVSVAHMNPTPTSAAQVQFKVTFSDAVTGVDKADFALAPFGVTGASIFSVGGSGTTYVVTVKTGLGNGTIGLNVLDDNTIIGPNLGRQLGGPNLGDGAVTGTDLYTMSRIPMPKTPTGTIWNATTKFVWSKLAKGAGAPSIFQYQYVIATSTGVPVYTGTVLPTACVGTTCGNVPTTPLNPGAYKWKVRALIGKTLATAKWLPYSSYMPFKVRQPLAGYWDKPTSWDTVSFYVLPNRTSIKQFKLWIYFPGCTYHYWTIWTNNTYAIKKGTFNIPGALHGTGKFTGTAANATTASGQAGVTNITFPGCGTMTKSYSWTNHWINSGQPSGMTTMETDSFLFMPVLDAAPLRTILPTIQLP